MLTITGIRWQAYSIPFRAPLQTAHGSLTTREGYIIDVWADERWIGSGEAAPLPSFGGASLAATQSALATWSSRLRGLTVAEALDLLDTALYDEADAAPARAGIEAALLDALGRIEGKSVSALLAGSLRAPRPAVEVNAVIGGASLRATVRRAEAAVSNGYRCLKLKVGVAGTITREVQRIRSVREAIGADVRLRLDANAGWAFDVARAVLSQCAGYAIEYIEQPLAVDDMDGATALRHAVPVPIATDEALTNAHRVAAILAAGAADVLVLKPTLLGGVRACQRIQRAAAQYGVQCVVTSTLETGLGVAAALHLAASLPPPALSCGLATLDLLEDDLIDRNAPALTVAGGMMLVPPGPGLGVTLDRAALARYSV